MSKTVYSMMAVITAAVILGGLLWGWVWWLLILVVPGWMLAIQDSRQDEHSLRRNFPWVGRARWVAEFARPFVRQYFMESETDGAPVSRMFRSIVYQRAKGDLETVSYGTKVDVYRDGYEYEWLGHSLGAHTLKESDLDSRVEIGGPDCQQKYSASLLNISAMSYGSLSSAALTALNKGAKAGGFTTTRVKVVFRLTIWQVQMWSGKLVLAILVVGQKRVGLILNFLKKKPCSLMS